VRERGIYGRCGRCEKEKIREKEERGEREKGVWEADNGPGLHANAAPAPRSLS
jgi:hypothetical protein